MESKNTIIDNPTNGQKRWRITSKKPNSSTKGSKNSTIPKSQRVIQCLQNSLQIAAAGQQYQGKKLPSKRPKKKPGMPKDFIFVDLSPVKNVEDLSDEGDTGSSGSPAITPDTTALDKQELITIPTVITPDTTEELNTVSSSITPDSTVVKQQSRIVTPTITPDTTEELNTVSSSITPDSTVVKQQSRNVTPTITPDTTVLNNHQELNADSYFELSASNDSFQSSQSDEESIFSSLEDSSILSKSSSFGTDPYIQECNQINSQSSANNDALLGLGILNMNMMSDAGHWIEERDNIYYQEAFNYERSVAYNSHINPFPAIEQSKIEPQFEGLKRSNTDTELPKKTQKSSSHRRAKSTCESSKKRSNSALQFRVYKAPSSKGKKNSSPELNHRRTISEPSSAIPRDSNAFDLMDFDNQMLVDFNFNEYSENCHPVMSESNVFTPSTDDSETEDYKSNLLKPSNMDTFLLGGCGSNEFLGNNHFDFDFNPYVSY